MLQAHIVYFFSCPSLRIGHFCKDSSAFFAACLVGVVLIMSNSFFFFLEMIGSFKSDIISKCILVNSLAFRSLTREKKVWKKERVQVDYPNLGGLKILVHTQEHL